jgi:hypothetical protein
MKPAFTKQAPGHHRCLYLSATGRQCRNWALDDRAMFCHRHFEAQPHGPDDFAFHLLNRACNFQNAQGIHDSIRRLYTLLACGAISPRRAAVLGYLTSLLLRTLPALYKDPFPEAGTPMSAAQLAEREKAKSPAPFRYPHPPHRRLPRNACLAGKTRLLRSPYLHRDPYRRRRVLRNLPPRQRSNPTLPLIPRRQPPPPRPPITLAKASAPRRPPAPNSPPKYSNP